MRRTSVKMCHHSFARQNGSGHLCTLNREIGNIKIANYKLLICWALFAIAPLISGCAGVASQNGSPAAGTHVSTPTTPSINVTLDQYGGRTDIKCTSSTGGFTTEKVNGRWWLCTPLGNAFFFQGVGGWTYPGSGQWVGPSTVLSSKYGGSTNAAALAIQNEFLSWGFNAVGEKSYGLVEPISACTGCQKLPEIQTFELSGGAMFDRYGVAPSFQPNKSVTWGNNGNGSPWYWKALSDAFDATNMGGYLHACYGNSNCMPQAYFSNPYFFGLLSADSDYFSGVGCGPDFDCGGSKYGGSKNDSDVGRVVLTTSPVQTFDLMPTRNYGGDTQLYTDTKVYSKTAMATPPANCSVQTPCSLRDFLAKKYGTVGSLDAAWGSNYTSFDSTGAAQSQTICASTAWNGSIATCSDTITNLNPSPESVQVTVDGTLQAGDCPWFAYGGGNCGTSTVNTGTLRGLGANTVASTCTINYTTGAVTINFKTAPSAGAHTIVVKYIQNGWMYGTGLMDEDGRHAWVGTNRVCLLPVAGGGPGTDSYSCRSGNPNGWPAPNANATLAADLETWIQQFTAEYFQVNSTALKTACPKCMYLGLDILGSWYGSPNKNVLIGAAGNIDLLFTELGWSPDEDPNFDAHSQTNFNAAYSYLTRYYGDRPIMNFQGANANPDSALAGSISSGTLSFNSQANRGIGWYNMTNAMLNTLSYNNSYQWVGQVWWGSHDFNNFEKTNWGLKTPTDNAYDGHEAVAPVVACSSPVQAYTCGGQAGNYGDAVTPIKNANLLWLTVH